ncbi:VOC family protein [Agromyces protaetiae]|uniref:VOC family protein n=1 Tax=Agromyces protaetiae TaxID=2509455 RepID=A0A4V0YHF4_9MICO|nr:VOC family protein [Agromyces protaetiae]QAY74521.1 VOC family protein [Agromyces protaetiae]
MFERMMAMAVLPAADLDRAQAFWRDVFGFEPAHVDEGGAIYELGGVPVLVYESSFAGTAGSTAMSLVTDDLDRDMTALRTHGLVFLDYDFPGLQTVDGVADFGDGRSAWFTDSEGNIVALTQPSPQLQSLARKAMAAASNG